MKNKGVSNYRSFLFLALILVMLIGIDGQAFAAINPANLRQAGQSVTILLDDFNPQPYQGHSIYYYNRMEGDRGALNECAIDWGMGQASVTIASGKTWGGIWMSLNHPNIEAQPINFSAILPAQIQPAYQSQITGITVDVDYGSVGRVLRAELKNGGNLLWSQQITLDGGQQSINATLPALAEINQLVLVLDNAAAGDTVTIQRITFTAQTQISDTATRAFVWSYGMLLANWNPATGLIRDKAKDPSGDFDAIQATGSLAAATALAEQLGVVSHANAVQIVNKIGDTLLQDVPRYHGLWPHWVKTMPDTSLEIVANTEWSSVDTAIAALGLLDAQAALGLDTSGVEQMLKDIDWSDLHTLNGIAHGYTYAGTPILCGADPCTWNTFGGESWVVNLAYAAATGQVASLAYPAPPTANGSGFIDEMPWLFVPAPTAPDAWNTDWGLYRASAADSQVGYYPTNYAGECFDQTGLFGLSAAEVSDPAAVAENNIYQAFGLGGQFATANDGASLLGAPVVAPHYAAMLASLRPTQSIAMWNWLINNGYFTPLNDVESLMFNPAGPTCSASAVKYNQLKGSWNLALQTLGWGIYLTQHNGETPGVWQAALHNDFLRKGYLRIAPNGLPLGTELDEDASTWGIYHDGQGIPTWELNNANTPSLDGRALRCAITGGDPYSNVHCYRNLPAQTDDDTFIMTLHFFYQPPSTFNNVGGDSTVQALEFTMNKWYQNQRYEWALQWDNVDTGAPKWRYWDANHAPQWIDLGITGSLDGQQWHTLQLHGEIIAGQIHYNNFVLDGETHDLNITVSPFATTGEPDREAIAVQLDGNASETAYELFLDHVDLQTTSTPPTVNLFTATSPSCSLHIPITAFTASDNIGVTGYKITKTSAPPDAGDTGWTASPPTTYLVSGIGSYTLYPWAKDAAGNLSGVYNPPDLVIVGCTNTFLSIPAQDGWLLESFETSNLGGSKNNTASTFPLGDDAANRQYRVILSFNTSGLPDNAIIKSAVLKIKRSGTLVGKNPFTVLGNLWADIRKGPFGGKAALQLADFKASASAKKVGAFNKTPVGGWYTDNLNATGLTKINKTGLTQFRLYFAKDDNNNYRADYMKFFSGNASSGKPVLVITYTLP